MFDNMLIVVCPDCGRAMKMKLDPEKYTGGGLSCDCGTVFQLTVNSQHSNEAARKAALREAYRTVRNSRPNTTKEPE